MIELNILLLQYDYQVRLST